VPSRSIKLLIHDVQGDSQKCIHSLNQGPRIGLILGAGEFSTLKFKSGKLSKLPKRVEHMKIMAFKSAITLVILIVDIQT